MLEKMLDVCLVEPSLGQNETGEMFTYTTIMVVLQCDSGGVLLMARCIVCR